MPPLFRDFDARVLAAEVLPKLAVLAILAYLLTHVLMEGIFPKQR